MKYIRLGKSDLKVSAIGYGGWALSKKGWQGVNLKEARASLEYALQAGINFIDTAPIYGFGESEKIIGEVIQRFQRKKLVLATKCGLSWNNRGHVCHNLSPERIKREVDISLKNLKTDYIDLYQIHWPDKSTLLQETCAALNKLHEQKIIRQIGACNFNKELLAEMSNYCNPVSLQDQYNFINRHVENGLLEYCNQNELAFIAYSPFAQGILSGKVSEEYKFIGGDVRRLNPIYVDSLKFKGAMQIAAGLGTTKVQKSLNFLLKNKDVSVVLISMTKVKHVKENIDLLFSANNV